MAPEKKLVFISFRDVEPDNGIARTVAAALSKEHEVFFAPDLPAGADWGAAIDHAIERASVFLVLVSAAVLEKSVMVRGEVEAAVRRREKAHSPVIVPVRLCGIQLPYPFSAYLNPYQFVEWNGDEDTARVVRETLRALAEGEGRTVPSEPTPWTRLERVFSGVPRREQMRRAMIERVRHDWIDAVLNQSLYALARIEIRFAALPPPHLYLLTLSSQRADGGTLLPATVGIQQVFDEHLGQLLILGVPGVGKTTLLLELARDLLVWSAAAAIRPIPVVLNLSSWAPRSESFEQWLVEELNRSYDVPRNVARQWVESEALILLLDGLDEVGENRRGECVRVFNRFREVHGRTPFVICSRIAEFESLSVKLRVPAAVVAQPLDRSDVEGFLARAGEPLSGVRSALDGDPALWELVDTPLMLSIVTVACQNSSRSRMWGGTVAARRHALFEQFVDAVLLRRRDSSPYKRESILHWLSWLAGEMQALGRTVVHLEDLNRDWLHRPADRLALSFVMTFGAWLAIPLAWNWEWFYKNTLRADLFAVRAVVLAMTAWLIFRPTTAPKPSWTKLRDWVLFSAVACAVALLTLRQRSQEAVLLWTWFSAMLGSLALALFWRERGPGLESPIASFAWNWRSAFRAGRWAMLLGAFPGVAIGISEVSQDQEAFNTVAAVAYVILFALILGISLALLISPVSGLRPTVPAQDARPGAGTWRSLRNAVQMPLIASVCLVTFAIWLDRTLDRYWYALILGATVAWGFLRGGLFCLQHFVTRTLLWAHGNAPWRYSRFLDFAAQQLVLRKVGGGYVFLHRTLLDYFAALPTKETAPGPTAKPHVVAPTFHDEISEVS